MCFCLLCNILAIVRIEFEVLFIIYIPVRVRMWLRGTAGVGQGLHISVCGQGRGLDGQLGAFLYIWSGGKQLELGDTVNF